MYRRLKECKSIREIYEVIPEIFYEKCSVGIIIGMFLMIIFETITRFLIRKASFNEMVNYYYIIGYIAIAFGIIYIGSRICKNNILDIKKYFSDNIWEIFLILLLILTFISMLMSRNVKYSFFGNWFRQNGFRSYMIYAALYICGKNVRSIKSKQIILWMFSISSMIQNSLIISEQMGFYGARLGAFYNRNHCGYFLCMAIFAIIGLIENEKKLLLKILLCLFYITNIWCLIINDTFGSFLAVIFGLIFYAILEIIKYKKVKVALIICILMFVLTCIVTDCKTKIISRNFGITTGDIKSISDKDENAGHAGSGRWELWIDSVTAMKKNSIWGFGPDNLTNHYFDEKRLIEPHNEFLQIGAEYGIPALICYVMAIISLLIAKMKVLKKSGNYITVNGSIVAAYIASAFFGVMIFYTAPFYYCFLGILSSEKNDLNKP